MNLFLSTRAGMEATNSTNDFSGCIHFPGKCIKNPGKCIANPGKCIKNPGKCIKQKCHCAQYLQSLQRFSKPLNYIIKLYNLDMMRH